MARILCDADPFCYGPISTLLSVVKHLLAYGHDILILGKDTALELSKRQTGVTTVECDTGSSGAVSRAIEAAGGADLFLSVLGDASIRAAKEHRIPIAYVDVLFWAWPSSVEPHISDADFYFIENDFEAADKLRVLAESIHNPLLVGPIVDTTYVALADVRNQLLVSYGGVDSPATRSGTDTRYHLIITRLLLEALKDVNPYEQVLIAGGGRAIADLQKKFKDSRVEFFSLSHDAFLRQLAVSRCLLSQPGLSTPLEGFAYGVPTLFLPPMNYSQVLQLRRLSKDGAAQFCLSWDELAPDMLVEEGLPEVEGIAKVLSLIRRLENDNEMRTYVRRRLAEIITTPVPVLERLVVAQTDYYRSLGRNGAEEVANAIHRYLQDGSRSFSMFNK
jgi:hypothetical protein